MSKNPNAHFIEFAKLVAEAGVLAAKNPGGFEADYTSLLISLGKNAEAQLKTEANQVRDSDGRPVCDLEFDSNRDRSSFIVAATYDDDGSDVGDDELNYLTDAYADLCDEYTTASFAMKCEDAYDAARGH